MSDPNRKEEKAQRQGEKNKRYAEEMIRLGDMGIEFKEWPKIKRLNRDIVITEKIDGTNAAIGIADKATSFISDGSMKGFWTEPLDKPVVYAQSRTRILTPENDNFGFAAWVQENAELLAEKLGPGLHFGEWWGKGIQRGYGLDGKRFSLFNVHRWTIEGMEGQPDALKPEIQDLASIGVDLVPVLYWGPMVARAGFVNEEYKRMLTVEEVIERGIIENDHGLVQRLVGDAERMRFMPHLVAEMLRRGGSQAAPGFDSPEGIVVYHEAAGISMKMTLENDEHHKGEQ